MKKLLNLFLISILIFFPQCQKKKTSLSTLTQIVNQTGQKLDVSLKSETESLRFFIEPNEVKHITLPHKIMSVSAYYHNGSSYIPTSIKNLKRKIRYNSKLILHGELPDQFRATIKKP